MPTPDLKYVAEHPGEFMTTGDGLVAMGDVVRATVIAISEEPSVPPWVVQKLALIGVVTATLATALAKSHDDMLLLLRDTPPRIN